MSKVYYDPNSVSTLKKEINSYGNSLITYLDKLYNALDEMDEIYNSPSGIEYKERFKEYILDRKNYVQTRYLIYEDLVDSAIKVYDNLDTNIKEMVGGE